jgi:hypothetical protein
MAGNIATAPGSLHLQDYSDAEGWNFLTPKKAINCLLDSGLKEFAH